MLLVECKPFVFVITQNENESTFIEFKVALKNFEDTVKARHEYDELLIMKLSSKPISKLDSIQEDQQQAM